MRRKNATQLHSRSTVYMIEFYFLALWKMEIQTPLKPKFHVEWLSLLRLRCFFLGRIKWSHILLNPANEKLLAHIRKDSDGLLRSEISIWSRISPTLCWSKSANCKGTGSPSTQKWTDLRIGECVSAQPLAFASCESPHILLNRINGGARHFAPRLRAAVWFPLGNHFILTPRAGRKGRTRPVKSYHES